MLVTLKRKLKITLNSGYGHIKDISNMLSTKLLNMQLAFLMKIIALGIGVYT